MAEQNKHVDGANLRLDKTVVDALLSLISQSRDWTGWSGSLGFHDISCAKTDGNS